MYVALLPLIATYGPVLTLNTVNPSNVAHVAKAIDAAVREIK